MSFSSDVKEELAQIIPNPRHCRIAELAAIVMMCGAFENDCLIIRSENPELVDMAAQLVLKLLDLGKIPESSDIKQRGKHVYTLRFDAPETARIRDVTKSQPVHAKIAVDNCSQNEDNYSVYVNPIIYKQTCCKRAFVRGAFMAAGSITDPNKDYHLEIVTDAPEYAGRLTVILSEFDIDAKIVARKKHYVVYIKDSGQIVDVLNVIEAHVALMALENVRIYKDISNAVNRRVNCEAANIGKTVSAAGKQIEDIIYLRDTIGLDALSPELRTTAQLRLEYPESSLAELGRFHDTPIGRSGVNHRLARLSEEADRVRNSSTLRNEGEQQ